MATACWAFILATATPLEAAPSLDISSLRGTNMKIHQQLIHNLLWMGWGQFPLPSLLPPGVGKGGISSPNYMRHGCQSPNLPIEVSSRTQFEVDRDRRPDFTRRKDPAGKSPAGLAGSIQRAAGRMTR
jgi:hypothetical protein